MTQKVFIPSEDTWGEIVSLMAYGAIVRYFSGGFEFYEMLADEDYIVMEDNDE